MNSNAIRYSLLADLFMADTQGYTGYGPQIFIARGISRYQETNVY